MTQTHLIIGAGNMGGAILSGWLATEQLQPVSLVILDPNPGSEALRVIEAGALHIHYEQDIPATVHTTLLAIKPQLFSSLGYQLANAIPKGGLILSIMAGISSETLLKAFPDNTIVRAMPNTPASIGKGVTGYVAGKDTPQALIDRIELLFRGIGQVVRVDNDNQIDAVTAISGSGPAYIFHLCEALAQAGVSVGLSKETATELARATIIGASGLLETSDQSAADLRKAVTSPNGTTQAALDVLMASDGLTALMRKVAQAAKTRAEELSL